jgi:ribosome-associated protein
MSNMITFVLEGDHLTLAQAVKAVGLADSGGQAKHLVRGGGVRVNGTVEVQPGRKLHPGDRFTAADGREWQVTPLNEAPAPPSGAWDLDETD